MGNINIFVIIINWCFLCFFLVCIELIECIRSIVRPGQNTINYIQDMAGNSFSYLNDLQDIPANTFHLPISGMAAHSHMLELFLWNLLQVLFGKKVNARFFYVMHPEKESGIIDRPLLTIWYNPKCKVIFSIQSINPNQSNWLWQQCSLT